MLARLCALLACMLTLILTPLVSIAARDTSADAHQAPNAIYRSSYPVITPDNVGRLTPVAVLSHSDNEGYNWYNALTQPAWSPDGRYLAAMDTGSEGEARPRGVWLYDVTALDSPPRLFEHSGILVGHTFSPDSVWIATITHPGYEGGKMIVWDVVSGQPQFEFDRAGVSDILFSPDRTRMASGGNSFLRIWDSISFQEIVGLQNVCAFDFMEMLALAGCFDYSSVLFLHDMVSGQRVLIGGQENFVQAAELSPDRRYVASGDIRSTIRLWGLAEDTSDTILFSGEDLILDSARVRFSPDGAVLASWTSGGNTINLWSVETGSHIAALGGHSPPGYDSQGGVDLQVVFAPDGQLLAATWPDGVTEDKNSRIWDSRSGNLLLTLPEELDATFSPDGSMLLTDSTDGTIKIWAVHSDF